MTLKLGVVACAALACACSSQPMMAEAGVPEVCQPTGSSTVIAEPEAYPGSTVTVHAAGRFVTCDGGPDVPVDVLAQVFSPSDQPLPLKLSVHASRYEDDDGGLARFFGFFDPDAGATLVLVDATFDTTELGLYHVDLKFEPNLGAIQQDVLSMVDRRGGGSYTQPLPFICDDFDVQQGIALCHEDVSLHTVRDGVVLDTVQADGFIADGADVWTLVVEPDLSVRLVDYVLGTDGSLSARAGGQTAPFFALSQQTGLPAMAWSQGQVLLVSVPNLLVASVDGGSVELRDAGTLPEMVSPAIAASFLAGEGAMVAYQPELGTAQKLCLFDFKHDTMECKPASALAADLDVVWTVDNAGSLVAWQIDAGPSFTSTTTGMVEAFPTGAFPESGFPFTTAFNGKTQSIWGPFALSTGEILRRPLPPPQSQIAGYGFWPSFQIAVSRGVLWSNNPDYNDQTSLVSYISR